MKKTMEQLCLDVEALAVRMRAEVELRKQVPLVAVVYQEKVSRKANAERAARVFDDYADAEAYAAELDGKIFALVPPGDERERHGQALAAGLTAELAYSNKEKEEIEHLLQRAHEDNANLSASADRLNARIRAMIDDTEARVAERTAEQRAKYELSTSVSHMNALRGELELARATIKRLDMGGLDNAKIAAESTLAMQLDAVLRVANGATTPEEGSLVDSAALRAVDKIADERRALRKKIDFAIKELKTGVAQPATAVIACRAALAALEPK